MKAIMVILIVLWVFVITVAAVNLYRLYLVHQLQMRVLKDYQTIAQVPNIFEYVLDSLNHDIAIADSLSKDIDKPFPLKDKDSNWMLIRLAVILLTIFTALSYWFYYKKQASD
jgi:flagellar basal body-associated protein FliL